MRIIRIIKRHGNGPKAKARRAAKQEDRSLGREINKMIQRAFLDTEGFEAGWAGSYKDTARQEGIIRRIRSPHIRRGSQCIRAYP